MTNSQASPPEKPAVPRSVVAAARLALLLVAAVAGVAAFAIAFRDGRGDPAAAGYVCPMHPEVQSVRAGQCPICGMALEANAHRGASSMPEGPMPGMADLTAVENVRRHKVLDFVRMRALPTEVRELRGAAWVEPDRGISAVFYTDQAAVITANDEATFTPSEAPELGFAVQVSPVPAVAWDASTVRLHFDPKRGAPSTMTAALRPGQAGWLEVPRKSRSVLSVPADAILYSPQGPYVLRALDGFKFEQRRIEIGETFRKQGFAVVLSGLRVQDRVVARAAFFIDADRRLENRAMERDWGAP